MTEEAGRATRYRGHDARRTWWIAFALFVAAAGAWALATPILTGPDEAAHAVRAAGVARGQLVGGPGIESFGRKNIFVEVRVPEAYAQADAVGGCFLVGQNLLLGGPLPPRPEECPPFEGGDRLVPVRTYEQRGQPVYYAVAGLPSLVFTGDTGVYLMRLVGAVIAAAALASALVSVLRFPDPRLAVLGLAAATTPTVLYLAGVVNSGGVENALAVCAWAAGLALVRGRGEPDRRLVTRTGLALVLLTVTRGFSPLYVLAIGATLLALAEPGRIRALLARRDVRAWVAAIGVAGVASAAWVLMIHVRLPLTHRDGSGLANVLSRLDWYVRQAVGVFGSNDLVPPVALAVLWAALTVGVAAAGLRRAVGRHIVVVLALVVGITALQIGAEGFSVPHTGFYWQGRYVLPLLAGVVLAATAVAGPRRTRVHTVPGRRWAGPLVLALLMAVHGWMFAQAARFYAVGLEGPANPVRFLTEGTWSPRWGPAWLFLVLFLAALGGLAALAWRVAATPTADDDAGGAGPAPGEREAEDWRVAGAAVTTVAPRVEMAAP